MAPTPIYLIFVDHNVEAPRNGSSANSSPLPSNGIPTSHPKNPPIKIRTAIFNLTIKPTANNAGEISPPKKKILFPTNTAPSKTPFNTPKNEIRILNNPPIRVPFTTKLALFELPIPCPASSTDAQAKPSGY